MKFNFQPKKIVVFALLQLIIYKTCAMNNLDTTKRISFVLSSDFNGRLELNFFKGAKFGSNNFVQCTALPSILINNKLSIGIGGGLYYHQRQYWAFQSFSQKQGLISSFRMSYLLRQDKRMPLQIAFNVNRYKIKYKQDDTKSIIVQQLPVFNSYSLSIGPRFSYNKIHICPLVSVDYYDPNKINSVVSGSPTINTRFLINFNYHIL